MWVPISVSCFLPYGVCVWVSLPGSLRVHFSNRGPVVPSRIVQVTLSSKTWSKSRISWCNSSCHSQSWKGLISHTHIMRFQSILCHCQILCNFFIMKRTRFLCYWCFQETLGCKNAAVLAATRELEEASVVDNVIQCTQ